MALWTAGLSFDLFLCLFKRKITAAENTNSIPLSEPQKSISLVSALYWTLRVMLYPIRIMYLPTENLHKCSRPMGTSLLECMGIPLHIYSIRQWNCCQLSCFPQWSASLSLVCNLSAFIFVVSRPHRWDGPTLILPRVPQLRPRRERCRAAASLRVSPWCDSRWERWDHFCHFDMSLHCNESELALKVDDVETHTPHTTATSGYPC